MTEKVYKLSHDINRFIDIVDDLSNDGYLESKFTNWNSMELAFYSCVPITLGGAEGDIERRKGDDKISRVIGAKMPAKISFIGLRDWLSPTDMPYIESPDGWPIMSRRMVDVLLAVGDFSHQIIPVVFKSEDEDFTAKYINGPPPKLNRDYVLLQLLELSDVLDLDKSVYTLSNYAYEPEITFIGNVQEEVLKEPVGGFPPIFRVKDKKIPIYVSAKAKEALEAANIQGLDFSATRWS